MSRKNHIHLADAFIYGYSNFTFGGRTIISDPTRDDAVATFSNETDNRFSQKPTPVFITPTMETVKPELAPNVMPTVAPSYEEERTFVPIIDIINPTPTYVKPDVIPTVFPTSEDNVRPPAPTPTPIPTPVYVKPNVIPTFAPTYEEEKIFVPIIDIINPTPTYVKPDVTPTFTPTYEEDKPFVPIRTRIGGEPYHAPTESINPSPYSPPPLIVGGGGAMGGGAMSEKKPLYGSVATKSSFLKKNFIPLLLIASAIYVFIKKPIK